MKIWIFVSIKPFSCGEDRNHDPDHAMVAYQLGLTRTIPNGYRALTVTQPRITFGSFEPQPAKKYSRWLSSLWIPRIGPKAIAMSWRPTGRRCAKERGPSLSSTIKPCSCALVGGRRSSLPETCRSASGRPSVGDGVGYIRAYDEDGDS